MIQEKNRELEAIFKNAREGLIVVDENKIIRNCNPRIVDILGCQDETELIGRPAMDFYITEEDYHTFGDCYREAILSGEIFQMEYPPFKKINGQHIWCIVCGSTLDDHVPPDQTLGTLWMIEDVTEKKALEAALEEQYLMAKDANPLTGLPGNNSIMKRIHSATDQNESVCIMYADLDYFKAYNDVYGFAKGDIVLKYTARVLEEACKTAGLKSYFIGNVGGDDFVLVFGNSHINRVNETVISMFDEGIINYYEEADATAKKLVTVDREGQMKEFPIMTISIAAVDLNDLRGLNAIEVVDVCSDLKKKAKLMRGSSFVLNHRRIYSEESNL